MFYGTNIKCSVRDCKWKIRPLIETKLSRFYHTELMSKIYYDKSSLDDLIRQDFIRQCKENKNYATSQIKKT